MIRLRPTHRVILWCVAAVLLPVAVGSLVGGLLALLVLKQSQPVADKSVAALSESYNAAGQDLLAQLAGAGGNRAQLASEPPGDGNIVFSPYSIGTAMALALSGARGETAAEMARALRQQLSLTQVDGANGKARAIFQQYGGRSGPGPATLAVANAVMLGGRGDLISSDYLATTKAHYAAEVFRNADLAAVNNWVNRATNGKIERIIERVDPNTAAVLLNAAYFKGEWQARFDPKLTRAESFAISASQTVSVPIMHRAGAYSVVAEPGFVAIRVPYSAPQLHMVIVLPDQIDALREVGSRLDGRALAQLFARLQRPPHQVNLGLPRLKVSFEVALKDHFQGLGMAQAFDEAKADFTGMTGGARGIYIGEIEHRAVIEVGEEGTEAAAATATHMATSAPPSFQVNRPFLFYIVEATTNAILFQGRIVDPR